MSRPTVAERWERLDQLELPTSDEVTIRDAQPQEATQLEQWQLHWPDPELKQPIIW